MLSELPGKSRITVGGDKAYDTKEFVRQTRSIDVTLMLPRTRETGRAPLITGQRAMLDIRSVKGNGTCRRDLRVVEDRRISQEDKASWTDRVGWMFTFGLRLQPGEDAKSDGGSRIKAGKVPGQQAGQGRSGRQIRCPSIKISKIPTIEIVKIHIEKANYQKLVYFSILLGRARRP